MPRAERVSEESLKTCHAVSFLMHKQCAWSMQHHYDKAKHDGSMHIGSTLACFSAVFHDISFSI